MVKFVVIDSTTETRLPLPLFQSVTVPFTVPVDSDQEIAFARVFAQVTRRPFNDSSLFSGKVEVFFNGRLVESNTLGPGENLAIIDKEVSLAGVKPNDINTITIEVEQGLDISTEWDLFSDFFYIVVNEQTGEQEEPSQDPTLEEPIEQDDSIKEGGILDFLFGDVEKTTRTLTFAAVGIGTLIGLKAVSDILD